ncbi:hypothetical protein C1645_830833 [Glomus cerebriforme]|uniref:Uncharacterized protein n=1 Tax=Glomus cerebriforme TaxID=658196 RepID=A0A397SH99_9GLOM|nr:hypothetical protein C1645_830833 [Glomus cerebriforme]
MSNSKQRPYEQENYPASPKITYYGDQKFDYTIILEGVYPPVVQLKYTEAPNYFPMPDNYIIKTTWGQADNLQYQVVSTQSPFDASVELHKIIIPDKRTAISEVYLFGLQLKCIDRNHKGKSRKLKSHEKTSITTQIKHAKGLVKKEQMHFENSIKNFYNPKDCVILKTLDFTVENKEYHVSFEEEDYIKKKTKTEINGLCARFPVYIQKGRLDPTMPIIHLWISGDGRNVGRKVKHVMITVALLDDLTNLFKSNYYYTTVLFSGTENYSTLKIAASSFIEELQELISNIGMIINNTYWEFELFFSSD